MFKSKKGWKEMPRDEDGGYTDSMDWDICWSDRTWVAQVRARLLLPRPVTPARAASAHVVCLRSELRRDAAGGVAAGQPLPQ